MNKDLSLQIKEIKRFHDNCSEIEQWQSTLIYHQILNRKNGIEFDISDHIRGIVYAMLSSNSRWCRMIEDLDCSTGRYYYIETVFNSFDPDYLVKADSKDLVKKLREKKYGNLSIKDQLSVLSDNISLLKNIQLEHGSVDKYIDGFIKDEGIYNLIFDLSDSNSSHKLKQIGPVLACEYLRNVGYDIPKPDRHICKMLGNGPNALGCFNTKVVPFRDAYNKIHSLSCELNLGPAELDYYLWLYRSHKCCQKGV